jgi:hypothetical protein
MGRGTKQFAIGWRARIRFFAAGTPKPVASHSVAMQQSPATAAKGAARLRP